jgi:hypothetical protein
MIRVGLDPEMAELLTLRHWRLPVDFWETIGETSPAALAEVAQILSECAPPGIVYRLAQTDGEAVLDGASSGTDTDRGDESPSDSPTLVEIEA